MSKYVLSAALVAVLGSSAWAADPPAPATAPSPTPAATASPAPTSPTVVTTTTMPARRLGLFARLRSRIAGPRVIYSAPVVTTTTPATPSSGNAVPMPMPTPRPGSSGNTQGSVTPASGTTGPVATTGGTVVTERVVTTRRMGRLGLLQRLRLRR